MKTLYVVEGESSVGSDAEDRISWLVRAYDVKQDAVDHAESAEKFATMNFGKHVANPWDSQMPKKYRTVYNVVECDYSAD